jgi:hypothetical protein
MVDQPEFSNASSCFAAAIEVLAFAIMRFLSYVHDLLHPFVRFEHGRVVTEILTTRVQRRAQFEYSREVFIAALGM